MQADQNHLARSVLNHIPAMVAYWDSNQRCLFSNRAYQDWFGRSPEEMAGLSLKDLLGPLYEKNLPYITAVLQGEKQVFERQIPLPQGGVRESIATYTPDVVDGVVRGFSVHVADVTMLREREAALEGIIREREEALSKSKILRGLLPICASCKSVRDGVGKWHNIENYLSRRTDASFTHGLCPTCAPKFFPGFEI